MRTREAYATSDGRGTIAIGADDTLDADDAFAQLVFHELCHAISEGESAVTKPDWGLDNVAGHAVREHACLRFARIWRSASDCARRWRPPPSTARITTRSPPIRWRPTAIRRRRSRSRRARGSTLAVARTDRGGARTHGGARGGPSSAGISLGPADESCGGCAWRYVGGRGKAVARCRQAAPTVGDGARTEPGHRACDRWEPPVDCQLCGACCREAYHSVTVSVRDPVVWKQPDLIVRHGHRFEIRREGERCAALKVGEPGATPRFACSIYADRPQACRDFEAGGRHCLDARRRVGLS